MKKLIIILFVALFGSGALAQDMHFGAKLAFDAPQFTGLFFRLDDTDRNQRGFGVRVTFGGIILVTVGVLDGEIDGYYRFARQQDGSGAYAGGGVGFLYAFNFGYPGASSAPVYWYVNGLLGYELQLGDGVQLFFEVRPTMLLGSSIPPSVLPFFGLGFLFEL